MKRPACNLCGTKHWPSEPHRFAKGDPAAPPERPTTDTSPVKAGIAVRTDAAQAAREQHGAALVDDSAVLVPGKPCPTCGKRVGRTSAERMRRHRAKVKVV